MDIQASLSERCRNLATHVYRTAYNGRTICVYAGWDRFLQECFLAIEFVDNLSGDRLVSSFDSDIINRDVDSDVFSFDGYLRLIGRLGIQLPPGMISAIKDDINVNRGASITDWTTQ